MNANNRKDRECIFLQEGDFTPYLHSTYVIKIDDSIYMCVNNSLFGQNEEAQRWEKIGIIPQQYERKNSSDYSLGIHKNKLLFWNYNPIGTYLFDLQTRKGLEYILGNNNEEERIYCDIYCMQTESSQYSVIVPMDGGIIALFDKEKTSFILYKSWREELDNCLRRKNLKFDRIRYQDIAIDQNFLYMNVATNTVGLFAVINLESGAFEKVIEVGCNCPIYGCLIGENNLYFQEMSETNNAIIQWNLHGNCRERVWNINARNKNRGDLFLCGDNVIFCSRDGDIYRFNKKAEKIDRLFENPIYFQNNAYKMMTEEAFLIDKNGVYLWDIAKDLSPKTLTMPWLDLFLQSI